MRFITEFELREEDNNSPDWREYFIGRQMGSRQVEMGQMLADSFGWQNPVNGNALHHRLEIEAFPMEKWIEFKHKLFNQLHEGIIPSPARNEIKIFKLIKELESFGKPAGDTITNQKLTNGTE